MAQSSIVATNIPPASNVAATDKVLVIFNANNVNSNASLRLVEVANLVTSIATLITGPYSNDAVANSSGVGLNNMYYDTSGLVHIRLV